jgi:hypothetical protein
MLVAVVVSHITIVLAMLVRRVQAVLAAVAMAVFTPLRH